MIGQTLGLYHIVEKIGVGGMGEVYCAHDHQLDSDVALKVLPPGTTADETARKLFRIGTGAGQAESSKHRNGFRVQHTRRKRFPGDEADSGEFASRKAQTRTTCRRSWISPG